MSPLGVGDSVSPFRKGEPAFIAVPQFPKWSGDEFDILAMQLDNLKNKLNCKLGFPMTCSVSPEGITACKTTPITTMMIRNIPYAYRAFDLEQDILEFGFRDHFDLIYLPMGRRHNKNLGFAFVNFHSSEVAESFKSTFQGHMFTWSGKVGCRKRATISAAHIQGFHANMEKLSEIAAMYSNDCVSLSCRVQGRQLGGECDSICKFT